MRIGIQIGLVLLFLFNGVGVFGQEEVVDSFVPKLILPVGHHSQVKSPKFLKGDNQILTFEYDRIKLWDTKTGKLIQSMISQQSGSIVKIDLNDSERNLFSLNSQGLINVWEPNQGSLIDTISTSISIKYSQRNNQCVNFISDSLLLFQSTDSTIVIKDIYNNEQSIILNTLSDSIRSAQLSHDKKTLSIITRTGVLSSLDLLTGQNIFKNQIHRNSQNLKYSPNSKLLLCYGTDRIIYLFNLESPGNTNEILIEDGKVVSIDFHPGNSLILVVIEGGKCLLYDLTKKEIIFDFNNTKVCPSGYCYRSTKFSPDGKYILQATKDGVVWIWDVDQNFSGKRIQLIGQRAFWDNPHVVADIAKFSPDGNTLITSGSRFNFSNKKKAMGLSFSDTLKVWNSRTGDYLYRIKRNSGSFFWNVFFSPRQYLVATLEHDVVNLWRHKDGKHISKLGGNLNRIEYNPIVIGDSYFLLTDLHRKKTQKWNLRNGKFIEKIKPVANGDIWQGSSIYPLIYSTDDSLIQVYGLVNNSLLFELIDTTKTNNNNFLVGQIGNIGVSQNFNNFKIWDINSRKMIAEINPYKKRNNTSIIWKRFSPVVSVQHGFKLSPNEKHLVIGNISRGNGGIKLVNIDSAKVTHDFHNGKSTLTFPRFNNIGNSLLTFADSSLFVWNLYSGSLNFELKFNSDHSSIKAVFSPDDQYIITGDNKGNIKFWNSTNGNLEIILKAYESSVNFINVSPDGKYLLSCNHGSLLKIWNAKTGEFIYQLNETKYGIEDAYFIQDNNYILTRNSDGSIKFWNTQSQKESLTLYRLGEQEWVHIHPSGLFDASKSAMDLMHYVIGSEILEFEQLKERYYEPGLYKKVMNGEPLRNVEAMKTLEMYPLIDAVLEENQIKVNLKERNGGIGKVSVFINGKEVRENSNPSKRDSFSIDLTQFNKFYRNDTTNIISLRSWNDEGWLKSAPYDLEYNYTTPKKKGEGDSGEINLGGEKHNPELYGIIIGTSDYSGDKLDLKYADKDAAFIHQAISQTSSALFGVEKSHIKYLSTSTTDAALLASKKNIKEAFQSFANAKPEDILFIYLSGHGMSYEDQFYYLTKDVSSANGINDPGIRENYTISSNELTDWITDIPAQKQVLVIDACSSGTFIEDLSQEREISSDQIRALDRMKDRTGMFVLAGSASDKVSYEASQYGQGVLTYSLLSGMRGQALRDNEYVDVSELFQFAKDEVPKLAEDIGGIQSPSIFYPPNASSFDIGIVNDEVEVPLEDIKPVFELSNFIEEESIDDILEIGSALDDYLESLSYSESKGLIFVPAKKVKNAHRINGRYTIEVNQILLYCTLYKNKDQVGRFELKWSKNDIDGLVEEIVFKVNEILIQE